MVIIGNEEHESIKNETGYCKHIHLKITSM